MAYFKYANFFVENVNALLSSLEIPPFDWSKIALPIGISFFTFQKMSYILDIYFAKDKPLEKLSDYALYIILFPQLIAGPIVRFNEIAAQLKERRAALNIENKLSGLFRFTVGLSKKLLIANPLGEQVDAVFQSDLSELGMLNAWIIITAYAFQIYFDFSGYSDMAIGIGQMMGFRFPENFNFPYIARSITEFWRRWHITLSNWMRDYLYIPLGGNRRGVYRTYFNLSVVFLISGLWHGAAWTFVVWGAFHGLFLILDRLFLLEFLKKIGKAPSIVLTFFITLIGWVLFRSNDFAMATNFIEVLFSTKGATAEYSTHFWSIFVLALAISFVPGVSKIEKKLSSIYPNQGFGSLSANFVFSLILLFICLSEIEVSGFNPFIYFRF